MEVLIADARYHGEEALTYSSDQPLSVGAIIVVPLRSKQVLGVAIQEVPKPQFAVKPITHNPELPPLPSQSLQLILWMRSYYPSPPGILTQLFLPKQLPKKLTGLAAEGKSESAILPTFTKDQRRTLEAIKQPGTYLLHGETGTGKTRVYIELARISLNLGKSVIILTPEIGLTSQLANDFRHVFHDQVVVVHSRLTDATRQRLWTALLQQTEPVIIIGPRSALFCPISNIGLIVVDEAHETAYKQDQAPYYHTSRVASKLAELHKAIIILGSATPLVTDYFMAIAKKRPILRMQQIASRKDSKKGQVSIVDLRDKTKFTQKPYVSDELIGAIGEALARNEQSLLFLNRRGTARIVFCEQCGWQATCPSCDLPLVYHGDAHVMRCHTCEFKARSPSSCPTCHNTSVIFKSIGTKAVVDDISTMFPKARVMRFDIDNKKSERIEQNYELVRSGKVDIIVGTQTLAKGLDLPKLSVVGVIIADTSLYFPDFSAQERTYQLLSQVIGRVGRGHRDSKAIVQTYAPESPLLEAILKKDWQSFYTQELMERKEFMFPPYCYLLKLTCRRASQATGEQAAKKFVQQLATSNLRIRIEGPAPAFREKIQNKYQWQIVIKARSRDELIKAIALLPSGWSYDIDPMNLL